MEPSAIRVEGSNNPYAGFWRRTVAVFIDSLILAIPSFAIVLLLGPDLFSLFSSSGTQAASPSPIQMNMETYMRALYESAPLINLLSVVVWWLYYAGLQSRKAGASIGMMVMEIRVTDLRGGQVPFGQATYRIWPILQVGMVGFVASLFIDYDMAKRTPGVDLDDLITGVTWLIFLAVSIPAGFTPRKQALH
ncbi:MAG: RDD family protein, partial [Pseudomonadota bacterium]